MATDDELFQLRNDSDILNHLTVACALTAAAITLEDVNTPGHAERLLWARDVLKDADGQAKLMVWAFLIFVKDQDVDAIKKIAATDMQAIVDKYVSIVNQKG